jgi:DNA mismatch repair protein MutL
MSDIIHLLPDNIANQIAAGEVIQRPASVVKELVENSIDAGATEIEVNIKDAGRTLVQVVDNGKGMSETDARMSFERHATSKISKAEDLYSLHTMGFRGEALASIVAVSQVELRTRLRGADLGSKLELAGSKIESIEPDMCPEGSSFSVKNLFYNIPARRKFLKSNDTEFRNILSEFERVALVNPQVAMTLRHQDVDIYNLPETSLRQRIINMYGKTLNQKLLPIDAQTSLVTVSGFVGKPDSTKKRGALQYFFVNGRFMKHPYFHKAVLQAYEHLIPAGEQPNYFVYFTLDPSTIDVNIHPTKTEIKFENEQPIWQILLASVRESLAKSSAIPMIDFNVDNVIDIPVYQQEKRTMDVKAPTVKVDSSYNPFENKSFEKPEFDWEKLYGNFENERNDIRTSLEYDEITTAPLMETLTEDIDSEEKGATCFQYKNRYIVTSLKSGLAIIDQSRAHYRILFDMYYEQFRNKKGVSQMMLFPEEIEVTTIEAQTLDLLRDDLSYIGYDIDKQSGNRYVIKAAPASSEPVDWVKALKECIDSVIDIPLDVKEQVWKVLAMVSAKSAMIKAGKKLGQDEMDHLLGQLFASSDMNLTPDGKTILTIIESSELDVRFD